MRLAKHLQTRAQLAAALLVAGALLMMPQMVSRAYAEDGCSSVSLMASSALSTAESDVVLGPDAFTVISQPTGGKAGTVQVGSGSSPVLDAATAGSLSIPETVTIEGEEYDVTVIGASALSGSSISEVTIPATVTRIGASAFANCPNLRAVSFAPNSQLAYIQANAFDSGAATGVLASITFPVSLKSIGAYAFHGQVALEAAEFEGEAMERLGSFAFAQCTSLKTIRIPALTAASSALGVRVFQGCTSLTEAVYLGDVASQLDDVMGTRHYEGCTSLKRVVYFGKKCIPTTGRYGGGSGTATESFIDSEPELFFTVRYYPSREMAESGKDQLGYVCVKSDTPLSAIANAQQSSLAEESVYEGGLLKPPSGFDCWVLEGGLSVLDPIPDSLYAYPADSYDLGFASCTLANKTFDYTGLPVQPEPIVVNARGEQLVKDRDYQLSYERQGADGTWAVSETVSEGDLRVVVASLGDYTGSASVQYSIARAVAGSTFVANGVTYCVIEEAEANVPGAVSVGDGESLAVPQETTGTVNIPPSVSPEGSTLVYDVVSIARCAFGNADAASACTDIEHVVLPESIQNIGVLAFANCTKLADIALPESATSIEAQAFAGCIGLESVALPSRVSFLGPYCFARCSALASLTLPDIESMRDHVFASCRSLVRVDFVGSVPADEPTTFAECVRLSRAVFHGKRWDGVFESNPTCYFMVTFVNAAGAVVAELPVKAGIQFSAIELPGAKGAALGQPIPGVPAPFGRWRYDARTSVLGGVCSAHPVGRADGSSFTAGSGKTLAKYRIVSNAANTAIYVKCQGKTSAAVIPASISSGGVTYQVVKVAARAFKGTKAKKVTVKSKAITSFSKAFKASKVKKVIVPKGKKKAYAKLLKKKACGKAVEVTAKKL